MRTTYDTTPQALRWFRIDKATATVEYIARTGSPVWMRKVYSAAERYFNNPALVTNDGRFQTPFAIYVREGHFTDAERSLPIKQ